MAFCRCSTSSCFGRNERRAQGLSFSLSVANLPDVSTIIAILEPHADGSLHLPLPPELRHGKVRVEAKLEAADVPRASAEMLARRKESLAALRALGGLKDVIVNPAEWQREQRMDRPLPGRE